MMNNKKCSSTKENEGETNKRAIRINLNNLDVIKIDIR